MNRSAHICSLTLSLFVLLLFSGTAALANDPTTVINQPNNGATIDGLTTVTGSVNFVDFERFELFLQGGGALIWAANGFTPIMDGNIAQLDPRSFADGSYQLVIRQVRSDSNYTDYIGPTIVIDNPLDAPQPYYLEVEPSFLYALENRAALRFRNCTGADLRLDYQSPQQGRSGGEIDIPARQQGYICPFEDVALIPGDYQGTINEGGAVSRTYGLEGLAAGQVYQLTYNGVAAGGSQIVFETVQAADMNATPTSTSRVARPPAQADDLHPPADVGGTAMSDVSQPAQPATQQVTKAALPVSGQVLVAQTPYALVGIGLLIVIVIGGGFAVKRRYR